MNIQHFALHVSEYLVGFKIDPLARNILYRYAEEISGKINNLILIGAARPSSMKFVLEIFRRVDNLSIAGLSYYLDARRFILYLGAQEQNVSRKYLLCGCPSCSKKPQFKLEDLKSRVLHNLNQLNSILNEKQASPFELYDLIVTKNEKTVIVSDIHIWTPESLIEDFIDFLKSSKPNHLILLGDIFDLKWGSPSHNEVKLFFDTLRQLNCSVHVVKGCCDGSQRLMLKAIDYMLFQETSFPLVFKEQIKTGEDLFERYVLDFYRFYRLAKDSLTIKLPDNSILTLLLGHQIIFNPKESLHICKKSMSQY